MDKKITIKDIAREAGVSIATVSYVLNNREDKRISEETKKKVLQVVNMFNYTCSFSARHISTGKTNIVALYVNNLAFPLCCAEKHVFTTHLAQTLSQHGYSLRLVDGKETSQLQNVDAIICYDTPRETFRTIGNNNFVPLLSYNNFVGDSLFYQVNTNYEKAAQFAAEKFGTDDFEVASLVMGNFERHNMLLKTFPHAQFVDSFDAARELASQCADRPLLVFEQSLRDYLSEWCENLCLYEPYDEKISLLVQKMQEVIDRQDVLGYDIRL